MAATTSRADIELQLGDGSWLGLMLAVERGADGLPLEGEPKGIQEALDASEADTPYLHELAPVVQEDFSLGVGIHYQYAEGVYTRTDGSALPSGAATQVTIPAGAAATAPIVAFAEFGGDLWALEEGDAANGMRVLKLTGGTGAAWTASLTLAGTNIGRDLVVFDNGAGAQRLYATLSAAAGGRLSTWDGAIWTTTAAALFGGNDRTRARRVNWTTDGIPAWRFVTISGPLAISYTVPNADPMAGPASWVEGVKIVTDTYCDELAAARRHVWVGTKSDVHDLDELGNSPGLLGYENRTPTGIRFPLIYHDGYVYRAGANTLDRIYVSEGATLQERPGMCMPGWGVETETEWRGYPTAFCIDQGYLVCAVWNPTTGKTSIWWGLDHHGTYAQQTKNPLLWYGPEVISSDARRVTAMAPSMLAGDRRLWIASYTGTGSPRIDWVSLPVAGAPLQDLLASGAHTFATGSGTGTWNARSRISLMPETMSDKVSKKVVHGLGTGSRGLAGTTKLVLEARADPAPGSTTWTLSHDVTASPTDEHLPLTASPAPLVEGYKLERRYSFVSPSGTASPPVVGVLDACRMTAWKEAPEFSRRTLVVEYGAGIVDLHGGNVPALEIDPERVTSLLVGLTRTATTTLRTRDDRRWTVHLLQVFDREETYHEGAPYGGKRVKAKLEVAMLAAL